MDTNANQKFKLFFPVSMTLFHGAPGDEAIEPYFNTGVSSLYVKALNNAIREHPTNAGKNGLFKNFSCEDMILERGIRNSISCAVLSLIEVNGELYGMVVYTLEPNLQLSDTVIDALKADLERQLISDWENGNEFELEVAIYDGVLWFDNGRRLESKQNVTPSNDEVLQNAILNVRVPPNNLEFIDTLDEFRSRIGYNADIK